MLLFLFLTFLQAKQIQSKYAKTKSTSQYDDSTISPKQISNIVPHHIHQQQSIETNANINNPKRKMHRYYFNSPTKSQNTNSINTPHNFKQSLNSQSENLIDNNGIQNRFSLNSQKNKQLSTSSRNINPNFKHKKQNKENNLFNNFYHNSQDSDLYDSKEDNQGYFSYPKKYFKPTMTSSPHADSEDEDEEENFIPAWKRFQKRTQTPNLPNDDMNDDDASYFWYNRKKPTMTPSIQKPVDNRSPFRPNPPSDEDEDGNDEEEDFVPAWERFNKPTKTPIWQKPKKPTPTPLPDDYGNNDDDDYIPFWRKPTSTPKPSKTTKPKPTKTSKPKPTKTPNATPSASPAETEEPTLVETPSPSKSPIVITEEPTTSELPLKTASQSPSKTPKSTVAPTKTPKPKQTEVPTTDDGNINVDLQKQVENEKTAPKRPSGLHSTDVIIMVSMLGAAVLVLLVGGIIYFTGGHNVLGYRDEESLIGTGFY